MNNDLYSENYETWKKAHEGVLAELVDARIKRERIAAETAPRIIIPSNGVKVKSVKEALSAMEAMLKKQNQ